MNTEFANKMSEITERVKKSVANWDKKEADHSQYWSCPTACMRAIAEYGAENIFLVANHYHGRYEDDDANFYYYNNKTGEFFHDEWSTRFAAPGYSNYECTTFVEAWENDAIDKEVLFKVLLAQDINKVNNFKFDPYDNFVETCQFGLRVEVKRGRKWKGTGYLVGTFTKSYQWDVPRWRSNNDYGTSTTRYAKIYDPATNRIESVNCSYIEFLDLPKFIEEYKNIYLKSLNEKTKDDICVGGPRTSFGCGTGDHYTTPMYIQCLDMESFSDWMKKNHQNRFDLSVAYDVVEEEAKKKAEEFKASKMPDIIKWVKENTDKQTEEEINTLAEHIFNKRYN